jgi:catechol 2,3-dioxygenase-like lactoylglutathione lyase family enzyme
MDSTQTSNGNIDTKLEVVVIPVADIDRSKRFYGNLGWRLDADLVAGDSWRGVQMTPPGSACSVQFGKGITTAPPGSAQGTFLIVDDIGRARAELLKHGAKVSEVFHYENGHSAVPGPDPKRTSYNSWAAFSDPDGNGWVLQEVKQRLPGRGLASDVATLTELLREAEERHGAYEANAPKHHWSQWYAAYIDARERGSSPEDAAQGAALHVDSSRH